MAGFEWPELGPVQDDPRRDEALAQAQEIQGALHRAGLAGITYPEDYGGRGLTEEHDRIVRETLAHHVDALEPLRISLGNCAPVILEHGAEEQRLRWLPDLLAGRAVACQLFSEPEAGSDVAAARTRAGHDGEEWVLSGQKVWTTHAHHAQVGVVLARTDAHAPKHRGLSMFLVELHRPGVEIRPIHQIDGGMEFDEVFFDDVHVPAESLLGAAGDGWAVASDMLRHQRIARGTGHVGGVAHELFDRLTSPNTEPLTDPVLRDELTRLHIAEVIQSLVALRTRAVMQQSGAPGPMGSLTKLIAAEVEARYSQLVFQVLGADAQAWSHQLDGASEGGAGGEWTRAAIFALSRSIAGGTSEIQRNIVGERVLGLPREPQV